LLLPSSFAFGDLIRQHPFWHTETCLKNALSCCFNGTNGQYH
jgi:hypothetical protein